MAVIFNSLNYIVLFFNTMIREYFENQKIKIIKYLLQYMKKNSQEFIKFHQFSEDVCNRLYNFLMQGKMIRGGLVGLGSLIYNGYGNDICVQAGAAVELFQSALLIHDDIMDRDQLRRSMDTIFYQYAKIAKEKKISDYYHFGEALGICVGDFAFFLGYKLLASLKIKNKSQSRIINYCANELSFAALAQMLDIQFGNMNNNLTENDIFKLYKFKTGRYSLSLPLIIGAILAECPEEQIPILQELGEYLGIIFQIKDDEIGLFGNQHSVGKPIGSDLKEGKKTLYLIYLLNDATDREREKIYSILGNKEIGDIEINYIRDLIKAKKIDRLMNKTVKTILTRVHTLFDKISFHSARAKDILSHFIEYNYNRKK